MLPLLAMLTVGGLPSAFDPHVFALALCGPGYDETACKDTKLDESQTNASGTEWYFYIEDAPVRDLRIEDHVTIGDTRDWLHTFGRFPSVLVGRLLGGRELPSHVGQPGGTVDDDS